MNRIDPSSQPLQLTPAFWIALVLVAVVGVARWMGNGDQLQTLGHLGDQKPVIIRTTEPQHTLPALGIKITLPEGWSYLSMTDNAIADQATFINESTHSIVSLRRSRLQSWPPPDVQPVIQEYGDLEIQWVEFPDRCVGRLTQGAIDVVIVAMTHTRKAPRNESVDEFCGAIELLDTR